MNSKAIADAIAARFVGVTATVGSVTESLASPPTASLPNAFPAKGPCLFVYHPTGELDVGVSKRRKDILDFPVRLLRDPLDYPVRSDWLYAWYDATRDVIEADMDLGLAYVAWAQLVGVSIGLDAGEYGGAQYDQIEYTVRVRLDEVVGTLST